MIQIEDNDFPITVAQKIILGQKPYPGEGIARALRQAITGENPEEMTSDMFDIEEIKEIADHLMIYYNAHKEDD